MTRIRPASSRGQPMYVGRTSAMSVTSDDDAGGALGTENPLATDAVEEDESTRRRPRPAESSGPAPLPGR